MVIGGVGLLAALVIGFQSSNRSEAWSWPWSADEPEDPLSKEETRNVLGKRMQALNYMGRYPTHDAISALHFVRNDSNEDYGYGAAVFDGSQGWQLANYLAKNLLVNLNT